MIPTEFGNLQQVIYL